MSQLPSLIADLAIILIAAGLTTILFKWLKQPLVLGYIVAGFLVGPHFGMVPTIIDTTNIQTWADIGVIFLLFALGLDFSFKKLMNVGGPASITAITILLCMSIIGYLTGKLLGWSYMNSIFLGGMLSMSSTTIIIKTFDDLGLRNKQFARLVFGVLIVEDLFAIVLMVLLSTIAVKSNFEEMTLINSILKLVFFLLLWFVVGIFLIPTFFKRTKSLMNDEMMLVVSLGLCLGMVLLATKVGFSSALGAFVMGSILAETVEAERIVRLVKPVKDLFGAIFFISVGGMINPAMLLQYWGPILLITIVVIGGQIIFSTIGVILSGQSLRVAVQSGFCFSQIGEFAFIIASLGLSLKVTSDFLYPIVVAVSVITTFLTPFVIKFSDPAYQWLKLHLPHNVLLFIDRYSAGMSTVQQQSVWKRLINQLFRVVLIYSVLIFSIVTLSFTYVVPLILEYIPNYTGRLLAALLVLLLISPFLRAMVVKKNHSEEFLYLWKDRRFNRGPLVSLIVFRVILCIAIVATVLSKLFNMTYILLLSIAVFVVIVILLSRRLKKQSILLERHFKLNLNERQALEDNKSPFKQPFVNHLMARDLHLADIEIQQSSLSVGKTLRELNFRQKCGVNIISIRRGDKIINIPGGNEILFPFDKITVLGTDDELTKFDCYVVERNKKRVGKESCHSEVSLNHLMLDTSSPFVGKSIRESRLREDAGCLVIGVERGKTSLMNPSVDLVFQEADVLWIVGEKDRLLSLTANVIVS